MASTGLACAALGTAPAAAATSVPSLSGQAVEALTLFHGRVYAGTDAGLFSSADGGATWTEASGPLAGKEVTSLTLLDSLLVAGTDTGVRMSADGATWRSPALSGEHIDSMAVSGRSLLVGSGTQTSGGAVQRSDDQGASFTPASATPALQGLPGSAVAALAAAADLMAGTAGAGVYRSTDGGAHFTATGPGPRYVTSLLDGQQTLAGTDSGLFSTADGGSTWSPVTMPEASPWVQALAHDVSGAVLAGTYDGSVYRSGSPGWTLLASGLDSVYSLLPAPRGGLLVGTFDGIRCVGCPAPATAGQGSAPAAAPSTLPGSGSGRPPSGGSAGEASAASAGPSPPGAQAAAADGAAAAPGGAPSSAPAGAAAEQGPTGSRSPGLGIAAGLVALSAVVVGVAWRRRRR